VYREETQEVFEAGASFAFLRVKDKRTGENSDQNSVHFNFLEPEEPKMIPMEEDEQEEEEQKDQERETEEEREVEELQGRGKLIEEPVEEHNRPTKRRRKKPNYTFPLIEKEDENDKDSEEEFLSDFDLERELKNGSWEGEDISLEEDEAPAQ